MPGLVIVLKHAVFIPKSKSLLLLSSPENCILIPHYLIHPIKLSATGIMICRLGEGNISLVYYSILLQPKFYILFDL